MSNKWCYIDTLLLHATNSKYHMAYRFVPFPKTLNDLKGHSRVLQDLSNPIRRTVVRHVARFQLTRRVARSLSDIWVLVVYISALPASSGSHFLGSHLYWWCFVGPSEERYKQRLVTKDAEWRCTCYLRHIFVVFLKKCKLLKCVKLPRPRSFQGRLPWFLKNLCNCDSKRLRLTKTLVPNVSLLLLVYL